MAPIARTRRADEIVESTRQLLQQGIGDGLTMRRLAAELGIQAPSLYKHFPDKESITRAVYVDYLVAQNAALTGALERDDGTHPVARVANAYRAHAAEHRALFLYLITLPYPREQAADVLRSLRSVWQRAVGDRDLAVAIYAFARGTAELDARSAYPLDVDPEAAYHHGLAALVAASEAIARDRAADRSA